MHFHVAWNRFRLEFTEVQNCILTQVISGRSIRECSRLNNEKS